MLRVSDVMMRTGYSRTTIWRKVRDGSFPPPVSLGDNAIGWTDDVIDDWVASRPQVHYAGQQEAVASQGEEAA
jgi:prophage regulatory protein